MLILCLLCSSGLFFWLGVLAKQKTVIVPSAIVLIGASGFFLDAGYIPWNALPVLALGAALAWGLKKKYCPLDTLSWTFFIAVLLLLGFHQFPGFLPYIIEINGLPLKFWPEKLFLLLLVVPMVLPPVQPVYPFRRLASHQTIFGYSLCLTFAVLIPLALGLNQAQWNWPSLSSTPILAATFAYNLIFVCIIEESFFRGILQTAVIRWLRYRRWPLADLWALISTSLLFGLAHAGGGKSLMLLATLAGFAYGTVFYATRRLYYAVFLHGAVNGIHQWVLAGVPLVPTLNSG